MLTFNSDDSLPTATQLETVQEQTDAYLHCDEDVHEVLQTLLKCPEFYPFRNQEYKLIFNTKPRKKAGRTTLASIQLFTDKDKMLHNYDAMIIIDHCYWIGHPEKREPLLYHELCHLSYDEEKDKISMVGHDVEDFFAVYKKYGDWQKDIEKIKITQLEMQFE